MALFHAGRGSIMVGGRNTSGRVYTAASAVGRYARFVVEFDRRRQSRSWRDVATIVHRGVARFRSNRRDHVTSGDTPTDGRERGTTKNFTFTRS